VGQVWTFALRGGSFQKTTAETPCGGIVAACFLYFFLKIWFIFSKSKKNAGFLNFGLTFARKTGKTQNNVVLGEDVF
jgi:hypothetical protein